MLSCAMQEPTDEELMMRYGGGDYNAFETLYQRHRGSLLRYLTRQLSDRAVAEELYQEVWLKVINARERYRSSASFRTYLYHIAHNVLIDCYRKQKPESARAEPMNENLEQIADPIENPERLVSGQNQVRTLLELLDCLPQDQRETFLLKEEAGLTIEEIAITTETGPETVKSRIRYAVNKLRSGLEARYGRH